MNQKGKEELNEGVREPSKKRRGIEHNQSHIPPASDCENTERWSPYTNIPYESSAGNKYPCYECKSLQFYTRIFHHPERKIAHYLCRNCTMDSKYREFKEFTIPVRFKLPPVEPPQLFDNTTGRPIKMYEKDGGYTDIPPSSTESPNGPAKGMSGDICMNDE